MVAQPQTAVVHGQPQTVLVAQQGQSVGSKTIIILQQQSPASATHHQKVVVTPQGQQVVVTQVPRPIAQSSSVSKYQIFLLHFFIAHQKSPIVHLFIYTLITALMVS